MGKENRYLIFFCHTYQYIVDILSSKIKESVMFTLKPMKLKAAMELDILCCRYPRQLVHSTFFVIGMPTLVTWAGSLLLSFCLIFSNFPWQRKKTLISLSPYCNLKWKYRLDFALHRIFKSETSIENVLNVSLYILISRDENAIFLNKT